VSARHSSLSVDTKQPISRSRLPSLTTTGMHILRAKRYTGISLFVVTTREEYARANIMQGSSGPHRLSLCISGPTKHIDSAGTGLSRREGSPGRVGSLDVWLRLLSSAHKLARPASLWNDVAIWVGISARERLSCSRRLAKGCSK
jgi:hypothetical protein